MAAVLALVLAGCTQQQLHGYLPDVVDGEPPVTNHTENFEGLWNTAWYMLIIIGLVVWGLIIWSVIVYRRRKGQTRLPAQMQYNMPIEIFYTIVPLILIIGFFAFTARDLTPLEARYDKPDVTIQVYAKQWAWDFNYVDENVYEPGIQVQPDDDNATPGSVVEDLVPTLYLPKDKSVEIVLDSRDVAHAFWVPGFLYKKDVIPGKTNYISLEPQREGTYMGKCAELCGEYHSDMLFNVKVVSYDAFLDHMDQLRDEGNVGILGPEYDRNTNLPGTKPASEE